MKNTANAEVRQLLRSEKIPYWKIAEKIGVHENTIVRRMRTELSDNDRGSILKAVEELKSSK